jgi:hypothetical protein
MQAAGGARARPDILEPMRSVSGVSRYLAPGEGELHAGCQLGTQHLERGLVGLRAGTNDHVHAQSRNTGKNLAPYNFAKASLQTVAFHDGVPVLRNNDADSWMMQKGSEDPNLEMFGSSSLPFA